MGCLPLTSPDSHTLMSCFTALRYGPGKHHKPLPKTPAYCNACSYCLAPTVLFTCLETLFRCFKTIAFTGEFCSHWVSLGTALPCKADRLGCSLFYSCKYSLSPGRSRLAAAACCVPSQKVPWPLRFMMRLHLVWSPCRGRCDLYGRMQPSMASVWSAALCFTSHQQDIQPHSGHTVGMAPYQV